MAVFEKRAEHAAEAGVLPPDEPEICVTESSVMLPEALTAKAQPHAMNTPYMRHEHAMHTPPSYILRQACSPTLRRKAPSRVHGRTEVLPEVGLR